MELSAVSEAFSEQLTNRVGSFTVDLLSALMLFNRKH